MSKVFTISEGLENMGAIKTGGQGSVYKGRRVGEIITAIKLLPTPIISQSEEDKHYSDFTNEVKKLQRVNESPNPNIVKILSYGVSETGCFPFIEMEYIDGPDLGELLKPPYDPVFSIKEVIKVAEHLSHALAHCHKLEVRHGDIKSNNVKFNKFTGNYVLLDFGLAILSDEERRTSLRRAGAIEFMAPEQNEGRMLYETDVYSFGIVLFELLAGRVPFLLDGNSETARNKVMVAHMETPPPDVLSLRQSMLPASWSEEKKAAEMQVPEWLVSLIYKCLEKRPEDRFTNGVVLHEYVSDHRVYTAEVAGIVKNEDNRWKSVLADKEYELQDLKAIVLRQDKELQLMRQRTGVVTDVPAERKTVSRSAFHAALFALLLVGALAVYGLFFHRSVVGSANANTETFRDEDSMAAIGAPNTVMATKKKMTTVSNKEKKAKSDSLAKAVLHAKKEQPALAKNSDSAATTDEAVPGHTQAASDNNDNQKGDDGEAVRYKVRGKAYFHDEPDASTKRDAFITHWNNAVLTPLDEKNGFVYIVFTNHLGQTSKGWIAKDDLIAIK